MADVAKPTKVGVEQAHEVPIHRIRITLTSKNVTNLEKGERAGHRGRCMPLSDGNWHL